MKTEQPAEDSFEALDGRKNLKTPEEIKSDALLNEEIKSMGGPNPWIDKQVEEILGVRKAKYPEESEKDPGGIKSLRHYYRGRLSSAFSEGPASVKKLVEQLKREHSY
jgi:hypothetical protein